MVSAVFGENWTCARATLFWPYFLPVRPLSLRRSAHFDVARSTLSALCACQNSLAFDNDFDLVILRKDLAQTCEDLVQGSCQETSERPLIERLHRDLSKTEILLRDLFWRPRNLLQRSCQETYYRKLVKRSCQETSGRPCAETLHTYLLQRSYQQVSCRDLAKRPLIEISYRPCMQISCRDLGKSLIATLYREILHKISSSDLTKTPLPDILYRDTAVHRDLL